MTQFKRDNNQKSNKLHLDKYYTSIEVVNHCIQVVNKVLKDEIITQIIEPSAGNGAFSKNIGGCIAYDIEPDDDSIVHELIYT